MVTYRFISVPEQPLAKQAKAILAIISEAGEIGKQELLTLIGQRLEKTRQKPQRLLSYYQGSLIKTGAIEAIRSVVR